MFRARRFRPFFLTQFLGAFNDNVFRNALIGLLVFQTASFDSAELDSSILIKADNSVFAAQVAYFYTRLGLHDDAARVLAEFDERAADRTIASASRVIVNLAKGGEEQALDWLSTAAEDREVYLGQNLIMWIKANVFRDPILDQAEFVALREQLGFTDL